MADIISACGATTTPPARPPLSFDDTEVAFTSKTNRDLQRMHLLFAALNYPRLTDVGTAAVRLAMRARLPVTGLLRETIFRQFVGGESIEDCEAVMQTLARYGIGTILDYSVEGAKDEPGFERTADEVRAVIERAAGEAHLPFAVFKMTGVARFALLAKKQTAQPLTEGERREWQRVEARVDRICRAAWERGVRVFIDGEETWIQGSIDALADEMMARYNVEQPLIFNTYQLYTRAALPALESAHARAVAEGYHLGAKLVRGAYLERERDRAEERGYADPTQPTKTTTDRDFDAAVAFCLDRLEVIAFCAGTHNEASCYRLADALAARHLPPNDPRVWFAQLYGMSDHISFNLARAGYNVAKYVPYGPVRAVVPYLIRRAEENTAVAGQSSRELTLVRREIDRRRLRRRVGG
ncbi:MAG: proline dehydrogenase family protein [Catalinimonas sp.]